MTLLSGARLFVLEKEGDQVNREIPIRTGQVKFGTHPLNTIRLKGSGGVERLHCKIFVRKEKVLIANYSTEHPVCVDGTDVLKRAVLSDGAILKVCGTRFRWQFDDSKLLGRAAEKARQPAEQTPTTIKYDKRRRTTIVRKKQNNPETASGGSGKTRAGRRTPTFTLPKNHKQLLKNIRKRFTVHNIANDSLADATFEEETAESDKDSAESSSAKQQQSSTAEQTDSQISAASPETNTSTPQKTASAASSAVNTPFYTPELDKENFTPTSKTRTPLLQLENSAMMILSYTPSLGTRSRTNVRKTPLSAKATADRPNYLTPKNQNVTPLKSTNMSKAGSSMFLIDLTTPTSQHASFVCTPKLDASCTSTTTVDSPAGLINLTKSSTGSSSTVGSPMRLIDLTSPSPKKLKTPSATNVPRSTQKTLLRSALKNASRTPASAVRNRTGAVTAITPKNIPKLVLNDESLNMSSKAGTPATPKHVSRVDSCSASRSESAASFKSSRTPLRISRARNANPEESVKADKQPESLFNTSSTAKPASAAASTPSTSVATLVEAPVMTTDELFDTLVGRPSIKKTYERKSESPKKRTSSLVFSEGSSELPKTDIDLWVESVVAAVTSPEPLDVSSVVRKANRTTQVRSSQYSDITPHESFADGSGSNANDDQSADDSATHAVKMNVDKELENLSDNPGIPSTSRRSDTPLASKIVRSLDNKRQTIGNFFTNIFGKLTVSPITRVSIADDSSSETLEQPTTAEQMSDAASDGSEDVYHDSESHHEEADVEPVVDAVVSSPKLRQSLRDTRKFIGNAFTSLNTSRPQLDNTADIDESLLLNESYGAAGNVDDEDYYNLTDLSSRPTADVAEHSLKQGARVGQENEDGNTHAVYAEPSNSPESPGCSKTNDNIETPTRKRLTQCAAVDNSPLAVPLEDTPVKLALELSPSNPHEISSSSDIRSGDDRVEDFYISPDISSAEQQSKDRVEDFYISPDISSAEQQSKDTTTTPTSHRSVTDHASISGRSTRYSNSALKQNAQRTDKSVLLNRTANADTPSRRSSRRVTIHQTIKLNDSIKLPIVVKAGDSENDRSQNEQTLDLATDRSAEQFVVTESSDKVEHTESPLLDDLDCSKQNARKSIAASGRTTRASLASVNVPMSASKLTLGTPVNSMQRKSLRLTKDASGESIETPEVDIGHKEAVDVDCVSSSILISTIPTVEEPLTADQSKHTGNDTFNSSEKHTSLNLRKLYKTPAREERVTRMTRASIGKPVAGEDVSKSNTSIRQREVQADVTLDLDEFYKTPNQAIPPSSAKETYSPISTSIVENASVTNPSIDMGPIFEQTQDTVSQSESQPADHSVTACDQSLVANSEVSKSADISLNISTLTDSDMPGTKIAISSTPFFTRTRKSSSMVGLLSPVNVTTMASVPEVVSEHLLNSTDGETEEGASNTKAETLAWVSVAAQSSSNVDETMFNSVEDPLANQSSVYDPLEATSSIVEAHDGAEKSTILATSEISTLFPDTSELGDSQDPLSMTKHDQSLTEAVNKTNEMTQQEAALDGAEDSLVTETNGKILASSLQVQQAATPKISNTSVSGSPMLATLFKTPARSTRNRPAASPKSNPAETSNDSIVSTMTESTVKTPAGGELREILPVPDETVDSSQNQQLSTPTMKPSNVSVAGTPMLKTLFKTPGRSTRKNPAAATPTFDLKASEDTSSSIVKTPAECELQEITAVEETNDPPQDEQLSTPTQKTLNVSVSGTPMLKTLFKTPARSTRKHSVVTPKSNLKTSDDTTIDPIMLEETSMTESIAKSPAGGKLQEIPTVPEDSNDPSKDQHSTPTPKTLNVSVTGTPMLETLFKTPARSTRKRPAATSKSSLKTLEDDTADDSIVTEDSAPTGDEMQEISAAAEDTNDPSQDQHSTPNPKTPNVSVAGTPTFETLFKTPARSTRKHPAATPKSSLKTLEDTADAPAGGELQEIPVVAEDTNNSSQDQNSTPTPKSSNVSVAGTPMLETLFKTPARSTRKHPAATPISNLKTADASTTVNSSVPEDAIMAESIVKSLGGAKLQEIPAVAEDTNNPSQDQNSTPTPKSSNVSAAGTPMLETLFKTPARSTRKRPAATPKSSLKILEDTADDSIVTEDSAPTGDELQEISAVAEDTNDPSQDQHSTPNPKTPNVSVAGTPMLETLFKTPARSTRKNPVATPNSNVKTVEDAVNDSVVKTPAGGELQEISAVAEDTNDPSQDQHSTPNPKTSNVSVAGTPMLETLFKTPARSTRKHPAATPKSSLKTLEDTEDAPVGSELQEIPAVAEDNNPSQDQNFTPTPKSSNVSVTGTLMLETLFKTPARSTRKHLVASPKSNMKTVEDNVKTPADDIFQEIPVLLEETNEPSQDQNSTPTPKSSNVSVAGTPGLETLFKTPARSTRKRPVATPKSNLKTADEATNDSIMPEETSMTESIAESPAGGKLQEVPAMPEDTNDSSQDQHSTPTQKTSNVSVAGTPMLETLFKTPARSTRKQPAATPKSNLKTVENTSNDSIVKSPVGSKFQEIPVLPEGFNDSSQDQQLFTPTSKTSNLSVCETPMLETLFKTPARSTRKHAVGTPKSNMKTLEDTTSDAIVESSGDGKIPVVPGEIDEQPQDHHSTPTLNISNVSVVGTPMLETLFKTPARSTRKHVIATPKSNLMTTGDATNDSLTSEEVVPNGENLQENVRVVDESNVPSQNQQLFTPTSQTSNVSVSGTPMLETLFKTPARSTRKHPAVTPQSNLKIKADTTNDSIVKTPAGGGLQENPAAIEDPSQDQQLSTPTPKTLSVSVSGTPMLETLFKTPARSTRNHPVATPKSNLKTMEGTANDSIVADEVKTPAGGNQQLLTPIPKTSDVSVVGTPMLETLFKTPVGSTRKRPTATPKSDLKTVEDTKRDSEDSSAEFIANTPVASKAQDTGSSKKQQSSARSTRTRAGAASKSNSKAPEDTQASAESDVKNSTESTTDTPAVETPQPVPAADDNTGPTFSEEDLIEESVSVPNNSLGVSPALLQQLCERVVTLESAMAELEDTAPDGSASYEVSQEAVDGSLKSSDVSTNSTGEQKTPSASKRRLYTRSLPEDETPERRKSILQPASRNIYADSVSKEIDDSERKETNRKGKKKQQTTPTDIKMENTEQTTNRRGKKKQTTLSDVTKENTELPVKILPSRASKRNVKSLSEEALAGASPEVKYVKPKMPKVERSVITHEGETSTTSSVSVELSDYEPSVRRKVMFNDQIQVKEINSPALVGDIIKKTTLRGRDRSTKQAVTLIVDQDLQQPIKPATKRPKVVEQEKPAGSEESVQVADHHEEADASKMPSEEMKSSLSKKRGGAKRVEKPTTDDQERHQDDEVANAAVNQQNIPEQSDEPVSKRSKRGAYKAAETKSVKNVTSSEEERNVNSETSDAHESMPATGRSRRVVQKKQVDGTKSKNEEHSVDTIEENSEAEAKPTATDSKLSKRATRRKQLTKTKQAEVTSIDDETPQLVVDEHNEAASTQETVDLVAASSNESVRVTDHLDETDATKVTTEEIQPNQSKKRGGAARTKKIAAHDQEHNKDDDESTNQPIPEQSSEPVSKRSRRGASKMVDTKSAKTSSKEDASTVFESEQQSSVVGEVEKVSDVPEKMPATGRSRRVVQKKQVDDKVKTKDHSVETTEENSEAEVKPTTTDSKPSKRVNRRKQPTKSKHAEVTSTEDETTQSVDVEHNEVAPLQKTDDVVAEAVKEKNKPPQDLEITSDNAEHNDVGLKNESSGSKTRKPVRRGRAAAVKVDKEDNESIDIPKSPKAARKRGTVKKIDESAGIATEQASADTVVADSEAEQKKQVSEEPKHAMEKPLPVQRRGRRAAKTIAESTTHGVEESLNESHMLNTILPTSHTSTPLNKAADAENVGRSRSKIHPIVAEIIEEEKPKTGSESQKNDSNTPAVPVATPTKRTRGRGGKKTKLTETHSDSPQVSAQSKDVVTEIEETSRTAKLDADDASKQEKTTASKRTRKIPAKLQDAEEDVKKPKASNDESEVADGQSSRSRRGQKAKAKSDKEESHVEQEPEPTKPSRSKRTVAKADLSEVTATEDLPKSPPAKRTRKGATKPEPVPTTGDDHEQQDNTTESVAAPATRTRALRSRK